MAHFELKIELDNQAFDGLYRNDEVAMILMHLAADIVNFKETTVGDLKDINGNKVGGYEFIK